MSPPTIPKLGIRPAELKRATPRKTKRAKKAPAPREPKQATYADSFLIRQLCRLEHLLKKSPDAMSKHELWQAGEYLGHLAHSPAAIEAMFTSRKGVGRPALNGARNDRASLDYEETKTRLKLTKMGNAKKAQAEVCEAWGISRTSLMEAYKASQASSHWQEWAKIYRYEFALENPNLSPAELLAEISHKLRSEDRAATT